MSIIIKKKSSCEQITENAILNELRQIRQLTLLNCKKALRVEDASLLTGMSKEYLYKLMMMREIPYFKSKKLAYFDRDELNGWMLKNSVKASDEAGIETAAMNRTLNGKMGVV